MCGLFLARPKSQTLIGYTFKQSKNRSFHCGAAYLCATLENLKQLVKEQLSTGKVIDESLQGSAYKPAGMAGETPAVGDRTFYIESYGCAMNFSDSEIVASILQNEGFRPTTDFLSADLILINTCSIRDKAEVTVRKRLTELRKVKKSRKGALIGVLGCMAERLKGKLLEEEKLVDLVVGPDAYRSLPDLIDGASTGQKGVNVLLSREETYADISPVRLNSNGVTAFISIMRGCNNMCSFCVVPFTRGRERSRDAHSIVREARELFEQGYREVTLLGQNVDSYFWKSDDETEQVNFAQLLEQVALVDPLLRVRFSTSHPKDITDDVIYTIAKYDNICNYIHLPLQSGNSRVLKMMNRTYTAEWYKERLDAIKRIIPDCAVSTDCITGFCSETEEEHRDTLTMFEYARYEMAFMFKYSERPGTLAARQFKDDVPEDVKTRRLTEIVNLQMKIQAEDNQKDIGKVYNVLVEGTSKKSAVQMFGRNSQNKVIVFPKENLRKGMYVNVEVTAVTPATLIGKVV